MTSALLRHWSYQQQNPGLILTKACDQTLMLTWPRFTAHVSLGFGYTDFCLYILCTIIKQEKKHY